MKNVFVIIIACIAIVSVGTCATIWATTSDHRAIKKYVTSEGVTCVDIDKRLVSFGPYWVGKDRRIYKVTTSNGREYWFRFGGLLGFDVEEKTASGYVKLK